ncbi:MAG: redox-regulated ATPase YchF [Patescibacteria group bacterium]
MLSCGIVGLPNVGKSTLFNALLKKQQALAANYPFATIEPNVGIVPVPDERLNSLAELVKKEEKMEELPPLVPAVVRFVDIAGLVKGASIGEGLGNKFLSHIRETDAIVQVVRDFSDENVIRAGAINPASDIETVNTELALADLQSVQNQLAKIKSQRFNPALKEEVALKTSALEKFDAGLNSGKMARDIELSEKEKEATADLNLLTAKPLIYAMNVDEADSKVKSSPEGSGLSDPSGVDEKVRAAVGNNPVVIVCAKLEAELSELPEADQEAYLKELGVTERGLNKVIRAAYDILGLQTYLTAGPKEVRAWTIKKGDSAPAAAGVIHTDFQRGFIAAEVISCQDLLAVGSYKSAREKGKIRLEGREYLVRDGDVIEFRFSV